MSVYKSPRSPYWQFDFQWRGRRFHGSTKQTSKTAAKKFVQSEMRRLAEGGGRIEITLTRASFLYFENVAQRQTSAKTTEYQLVNLNTFLGKDRHLSDIDQADIAAFAAARRAEVSDSSVNREIQLARRLWRYAAKKLKAEVSAVEWSDLMYAEPKERVRELHADEEERLFNALREDYRDLIAFVLLCGPRMSGAISLRWSDVNAAAMSASVQKKGGGYSHLVLTPSMLGLIRRQPKVGPFVFTYVCQKNRKGRRAGKRYPITKGGLNRIWRRALDDAGIENFRFHDLRHTAATRLVRETGNLKMVQRLLDHADIATTSRYAHVADDDLRKALESVEIKPQSRNIPGIVPLPKKANPGK